MALDADTAQEELIAEDAVADPKRKEAVTAFCDQLEVPNKEPVMIGELREPVTCSPFVYRPDPDTSNENIGRG
jgi:hypothetical protein